MSQIDERFDHDAPCNFERSCKHKLQSRITSTLSLTELLTALRPVHTYADLFVSANMHCIAVTPCVHVSSENAHHGNRKHLKTVSILTLFWTCFDVKINDKKRSVRKDEGARVYLAPSLSHEGIYFWRCSQYIEINQPDINDKIGYDTLSTKTWGISGRAGFRIARVNKITSGAPF